ncbi:DUF1697 domain-containing protein [Niabella ginsenosidivorans]|uniref:DUF1697 domain-containing protein n=1 Tax=Niabella ginsenosidivorans TaxID=1176587 RepID=UPI001470FBA2|nr:DUF1697 domain-containing protein [Niabella ginsenosidivorans]
MEKNGYQKIQTILQAGNIISDAPEKHSSKLQKKLETALTKTFNYPASGLVITMQRLQTAVTRPIQAQNGTVHRIFPLSGMQKYYYPMLKQKMKLAARTLPFILL